MWNKLIGGAIIIGVICGTIFSFKYLPVSSANSDLQQAFQDCISSFQQEQEPGCRLRFKKIIDENHINIDPSAIKIDAAVNRQSTVDATYTETLDFFGFWKYTKTFTPHAEGIPQRRT